MSVKLGQDRPAHPGGSDRQDRQSGPVRGHGRAWAGTRVMARLRKGLSILWKKMERNKAASQGLIFVKRG